MIMINVEKRKRKKKKIMTLEMIPFAYLFAIHLSLLVLHCQLIFSMI